MALPTWPRCRSECHLWTAQPPEKAQTNVIYRAKHHVKVKKEWNMIVKDEKCKNRGRAIGCEREKIYTR